MWKIFVSGGPVMYPLLACSIIVLTVIFERTFFWIRLGIRRNPRLVDEILELSRRADWDAIRELLQNGGA